MILLKNDEIFKDLIRTVGVYLTSLTVFFSGDIKPPPPPPPKSEKKNPKYQLIKKFWPLSPFVPMEFPIKFDTVKSGWFIVYLSGHRLYFSKKSCICFSEDRFCLSIDSADPDEMPHYAAFRLDLHC